jgi:hypothetical protein
MRPPSRHARKQEHAVEPALTRGRSAQPSMHLGIISQLIVGACRTKVRSQASA